MEEEKFKEIKNPVFPSSVTIINCATTSGIPDFVDTDKLKEQVKGGVAPISVRTTDYSGFIEKQLKYFAEIEKAKKEAQENQGKKL